MLHSLFTAEGFMPHGHSYLWTSGLLWLYIVSDAVIALAYYSIPVALLYFARKRGDIRFNWMFVMFSAFIFACGTTHLLSIWTIWHPDYWLDASMKAVTALISVVTAIRLWPLIPKAIKMPTVTELQQVIAQLEHEVAERKSAETALRQSEATLRDLARHQNQIREEERKRIAREIHDELGQNLLALRIDASMLLARSGDSRPKLKERAEAAIGYIDTTIKSVRSIMNNLRPAVLDIGLVAAIEWQVKEFMRISNVKCELEMQVGDLAFDDATATAAFRILQESLTNVGRHARATRVHILVVEEAGLLRMTIRDDGIGMNPQQRKPTSFGLIGMKERALMLGGALHVDSTPGEGTVVSISIPITAPQPSEETTSA
jgi:signal transduction histidine kinase